MVPPAADYNALSRNMLNRARVVLVPAAMAAAAARGAVRRTADTTPTTVRLKPDATSDAVRLTPAHSNHEAVRGVRLQPDHKIVDWPFYGGDQAGTKFSPLTDVNMTTVGRLAVAWEWKTGEKALDAFGTRPGTFQA